MLALSSPFPYLFDFEGKISLQPGPALWLLRCYRGFRRSGKNLAYEEYKMSIQKKSLLSSLNATKKAIVASSTTPAQVTPSVNARISTRVNARISTRVKAPIRRA